MISRVLKGAAVAAVTFSLAACGGDAPQPESETATPAADAPAAEDHATHTGASRVFFVSPKDGETIKPTHRFEFGSEAVTVAAVPEGEITEAQVRACADFALKFARDLGALDDTAYAGIATRSGVRSGRSKRAIAQRLAAKGIARDTAAAALEEADDLYAAVVMARKRAFGPFRKADLDEKRQATELSAFARGGFGFDLAKRVFGMSLEDAEDILASRRL